MVKPFTSTIIGWKGLPFDVARNQLVKDAKALGAKYLLFWDSDVLPPKDAIVQLLSWHVPVISALIWSKRGHPAIWRRVPGRPQYQVIKEFASGSYMLEVDAIPMGFCLIDMRVFDVVPEPWFRWTIVDPTQIHEGHFSEDFEFCRKVQDHGLPIFCHIGVKARHETLLGLDPYGERE